MGAAFGTFLIALILGVIIGYLKKRWEEHDTGRSGSIVGFLIGSVVVAVIAGSITLLGYSMAYKAKVTFTEFWNGWELSTQWLKVTCTRDGPCRWEYSCDPYIVTSTYEDCSGSGKDRTCTTRTKTETKYHDCPYVKEEWTFVVNTTVGDFTIRDHGLPDDLTPWRSGNAAPQAIIDRAGRGVPAFWKSAYDRVNTGKPGPATKQSDYENFLLASDQTLLKQYSGDIESLKAQNLLPPIRKGVRDFYFADKVYFVGLTPTNASTWQLSHAYLNASIGEDLHGDLHVVFVNKAQVQPDVYIMALKAYWQNKEIWGKNTLPKNSILVVFGVNGDNIEWGRATTGMPLGNEGLQTAVQSYYLDSKTRFEPEAVFGGTTGTFYEKVSDGKTKTKVRSSYSGQGSLQRLLYAPETGFVRVSMSANDSNDVGSGFQYLTGEIQPSDLEKLAMVLVSVALSAIMWFILPLVVSYDNRW